MCTLVGFGADAICPRVALEMITRLRGNTKLARNADGSLPDTASLQAKFIKAIHKGILKVIFMPVVRGVTRHVPAPFLLAFFIAA